MHLSIHRSDLLKQNKIVARGKRTSHEFRDSSYLHALAFRENVSHQNWCIKEEKCVLQIFSMNVPFYLRMRLFSAFFLQIVVITIGRVERFLQFAAIHHDDHYTYFFHLNFHNLNLVLTRNKFPIVPLG